MAIKCPKCNFTLEDDTKFCPNCGKQLIQDQPADKKSVSTPMKRNRNIIVIVVIVILILSLIGICNNNNEPSAVNKPITKTYTPPPKPITKPPVETPALNPNEKPRDTGLTFQMIKDKTLELTDVQFVDYAATLKGRKITWSGWIEDVIVGSSGGYEAMIDFDSPEITFSLADIHIPISESLAKKFTKNQRVTFTATIRSVTYYLAPNIILDNVKFIE
jgi:hypothetical protein